jgi:lipopolysaccharide/colanic/teichoic acid biosynthesis glycosyltransferase
VGRNGRTFDMLKFRSFPTDHKDVALALPLDDCPLPVGRFLRRTSIDELPQLFNVLRGEMSIVGPRPERPHFAEPMSEKIPDYDARHRVAGGLTGLAQVHGYWGVSEIEARVRLDNHYIDTWSLWGDLSIIARTVPAVIVKSFA